MQLDKESTILVTGAGGFIGGHLMAELIRSGHQSVRGVDIKPLEEWYQLPSQVEAIQSDLSLIDAANQAVSGVRYVVNLAADMGGMGFIENNKALCMLTVLINTNLLQAARHGEVERYFYSSSACVYASDIRPRPT